MEREETNVNRLKIGVTATMILLIAALSLAAVAQAAPVGPSPAGLQAQPPAQESETIYVVRRGDTLSGIARQFGITVSAILAANPSITNPNRIYVGQRLIIPSESGQTPPSSGPEGYLDDRSSPEAVMRSFVNAINRKEYLRAYSYWEPQAAASELPPFEEFARGYDTTESVELTIGTVTGDAGAGNFFYRVPVTFVSRLSDGTIQTFVGCYTLHLANPTAQATPPYQPMGIRSADVQQVANDADTGALMSQACQQ